MTTTQLNISAATEKYSVVGSYECGSMAWSIFYLDKYEPGTSLCKAISEEILHLTRVAGEPLHGCIVIAPEDKVFAEENIFESFSAAYRQVLDAGVVVEGLIQTESYFNDVYVEGPMEEEGKVLEDFYFTGRSNYDIAADLEAVAAGLPQESGKLVNSVAVSCCYLAYALRRVY